jgi:hypothetical protein
MAKFTVMTGMTYEVEADTEEQALEIFYAFDAGDDCPCGRPQWGEYAAEEGHDLCDCLERGEQQTVTL